MPRAITAASAALLLGFACLVQAAPPAQIDVMTQNQYLGADLTPVVDAGARQPFDPVAFNTAVITALAQVAANLPEQRQVALAREIAGRSPHVVGLQEVFEFSCQGPGCAYQAISGAFSDHLSGTLDALGGRYVAVATVRNLNVTLPIVTPVGSAYVTVLDRDVILVRRDVAPTATVVPFGLYCSYPSLDGCNYDVVAEASIDGNPLRIERGFVGVNLTVSGRDYRIVNTHLEVREPAAGNPFSRYFQSAQAYQLVQSAAAALEPGRRLVVVGDFNSAPEDAAFGPIVPPYRQMMSAGYTDAWTMRPGAGKGRGAPVVGLSCCQLEDLSNRKSMLYERIDLLFALTRPAKVLNARLIGDTVNTKTPPAGLGVWPSDHAAVAATLRY